MCCRPHRPSRKSKAGQPKRLIIHGHFRVWIGGKWGYTYKIHVYQEERSNTRYFVSPQANKYVGTFSSPKRTLKLIFSRHIFCQFAHSVFLYLVASISCPSPQRTLSRKVDSYGKASQRHSLVLNCGLLPGTWCVWPICIVCRFAQLRPRLSSPQSRAPLLNPKIY